MIVAVSWKQVYGTKMDKRPKSGRNIWDHYYKVYDSLEYK